MSIASDYCKEISEQIHYRPTWMPTHKAKLGDYGLIKDEVFQRWGNISGSKYKISVKKSKDQATADLHYKSRGSREIEVDGGVDAAGIAKAAIKIQFSKAHSVFFNLAGVTTARLDNYHEVAEKIMSLGKSQWNYDFRVITEIVKAKSSTIIITSGKNASITLGVDSPVMNFANINLKLNAKSSSKISTKILTKSGFIPAFKTSGIKERKLGPIPYGPTTFEILRSFLPLE